MFEADDDGLYVVKFSGAGQGPKALIAEQLAGEIGRALGLAVPELVLVDLDPALGAADPDYEQRTLIERSAGRNLGMDFLSRALMYLPAGPVQPTPEEAADIVWFDALITNVDRTARNPNLLIWHRRLWLIDHGAALYIHHTWENPAEHARRPFEAIQQHVLLPVAGPIADADSRLAPQITEDLLSSILGELPDEWLAADGADPTARRQDYLDYLTTRLTAPRLFVAEADRGRP